MIDFTRRNFLARAGAATTAFAFASCSKSASGDQPSWTSLGIAPSRLVASRNFDSTALAAIRQKWRGWHLAPNYDSFDRRYESLSRLFVASDGRQILSVGYGHLGVKSPIRLWDSRSGLLLASSTERDAENVGKNAVAFAANARRLATINHEWGITQVWSPLAFAKPIEIRPAKEQRFTALAFDPGSSRLAIGGDDGKIVIANATTGSREDELLDIGRKGVNRVAFARQGKTLLALVGQYETELVSWDLTSRQVRRVSASGRAEHLQVSPNQLEFTEDGTTIRRVSDLEVVKRSQVPSGAKLIFSSSGRHLLVVKKNSLDLLQLSDEQKISTIDPKQEVIDAEILPNGDRMALVVRDTIVIKNFHYSERVDRSLQLPAAHLEIRRLPSGDLLGSSFALPGSEYATISPSGFFAASANAARFLCLKLGNRVAPLDDEYISAFLVTDPIAAGAG